jgi:CheY-like chemotaxis protein
MPHILLVEDEPLVALVIETALAEEGFDVSTASDGVEALRLAASAKIDLLLTDVLMPGMDGIELVAALRRTRPGLPVVLMTGYVPLDGRDALARLRDEGTPILHKPFPPEAAAAAVRARLARVPGQP